jgi:hypothetical protein
MMQSSIDIVEKNITAVPDRIRYFLYFGAEEMIVTLMNALGIDVTNHEGFLYPGS